MTDPAERLRATFSWRGQGEGAEEAWNAWLNAALAAEYQRGWDLAWELAAAEIESPRYLNLDDPASVERLAAAVKSAAVLVKRGEYEDAARAIIERLRAVLVGRNDLRADLDAALAAERRATVERIRAAVLAEAFIPQGVGDRYLAGIATARTHYLAILDAEAGEDAESNHPNAEWNR